VPDSRADFWRTKLIKNRERDEAAIDALQALGWRVLVVWDCYLRGCKDDGALAAAIAEWLEADEPCGELSAGQTATPSK
jgi:DNA mismatch endonuclease (patch repair protein)